MSAPVHPTAQLIDRFYAAFARRDIDAMLALIDPAVEWCEPANPFNPAVTIFVRASRNIESNNASVTPLHVAIYNVNGRFITGLKLRNGQATWDASNQPSGIYLLQVKIGRDILRKRVSLIK